MLGYSPNISDINIGYCKVIYLFSFAKQFLNVRTHKHNP